jgi:hypothetical protein
VIFNLINQAVRLRCCEAIMSAAEGMRVEIKERKRSLDQNAKLHATLGDIAKQVPWAGKNRDTETWKRLMTAAWLRARGDQVEFLPALDGHGVDVVFRRTSDLTISEVAELLEYINAWVAENQVSTSDEHFGLEAA